jgi:hypothetical protein
MNYDSVLMFRCDLNNIRVYMFVYVCVYVCVYMCMWGVFIHVLTITYINIYFVFECVNLV